MDAQELRDRSQKFPLDIIRFCDELPKDRRTQETAAQRHDAAHSVAMNYRAAAALAAMTSSWAKMCVTVEEADEAQGWLDTLIKSKKASGAEAERLFEESTELLKIFSASKRTAMRNQSQRRSLKRRVTKPKNR